MYLRRFSLFDTPSRNCIRLGIADVLATLPPLDLRLDRYASPIERPLLLIVFRCYSSTVSIIEIEKAIEQLTMSQVDELAAWLDNYRTRCATASEAETWLSQAKGAARPGATTAEIMALTRGDE